MASAVRMLSSVVGRNDAALQQETEKYRLLVTAGPSYDQREHQVVPVNTDTPIVVENEFVTAKIVVRVRGFRGLPAASPESSSYFDDPIHERDQYSLGFSFVPKKDIRSLNTVWGNDFDHPIRNRIPPPFVINTAFRIVKEFIDPGLELDAYADEPWVYGPSLSCWFGLRIGDKVADGEDFPAPANDNVLKEGADGSGQEIRHALHLPDNNEKRRKFFLDPANRETFVFEKGRCYQGDFYNPYIDFGNFLLKLPGFSLKVIKYVEEKTHCLRYVFKDRSTGDVFFNVNFHLLWGQELEEAIKEDGKDQGQGTSAVDSHLTQLICKGQTVEAGAVTTGSVEAVDTTPGATQTPKHDDASAKMDDEVGAQNIRLDRKMEKIQQEHDDLD